MTGANQKTWLLERYEGDTQPSLADLLSQSIEDFDLAEPGRHPVDATAADPGDAAPSSASKIPMKQFDSEAFSGKTGRNLALLRADTNSGQGMAHKVTPLMTTLLRISIPILLEISLNTANNAWNVSGNLKHCFC